jgi:hypothetical protein
MAKATFQIWRGDSSGGKFESYSQKLLRHGGSGCCTPDTGGNMRMIWRCVGIARPANVVSCSAEINGMPKLMCMDTLE